jgi:hypothetical protein
MAAAKKSADAGADSAAPAAGFEPTLTPRFVTAWRLGIRGQDFPPGSRIDLSDEEAAPLLADGVLVLAEDGGA